MPYKRILLQIAVALPTSLLIGFLTITTAESGEVLQSQRTVQLTLLPDYSNSRVMVVGMAASPTATNIEEVQLKDWGFEGDLNLWTSDPGKDVHSFYFQGILTNATLEPPTETGSYSIVIGPLQFPPGDTLMITIPFASLIVDEVSPAPQNRDEVINSKLPVTSLLYSASEKQHDLTIEIPFVPINKEIDLSLFPLLGELLLKHQDSYRLFGQVTFEDIKDFTIFERYCQSTVEDPFWPYRMADTLFALDYLPVFHFGYLPPAYQYKPSYLLVRSELKSCNYEDSSGQVVTSITGRVFHQPEDKSLFPEFLRDQDVPEQQAEIRTRGTGTGIYEVQLGSIFLGPGDRLKLTLPGTDLRSVSPAPTRFSHTDTGDTLIEFDGPKKFVLKVRYAPRAGLFVQQLPATIRAFGSNAENYLSSLNTGPGTWQPWAVLFACLTVLAVVQRFAYSLKLWQRGIVWFVAGVLCYYSFPHVFGLIFLAIGLHLLASFRTGSQDAIIRNILILLLAVAFLALDTKSKDLIFMLDGYHLDLTLFTPSLLTFFGFITFLLYRNSRKKTEWTTREIIGPALLLLAFSILDGLQKSLPGFLVASGLFLVSIWRYDKISRDEALEPVPDIPLRFRAVWESPFFWIGLLTLSIFAITNDITTTAEVLSPKLGVIRFLLGPILLFLSVVFGFLSTGALFLLLYPSLPFQEGYLKAIVFALSLLLIFILGVGADNRFVIALPSTLVGRFIYYLSAPLLIGIFMEVTAKRGMGKATDETEETTDKKAATETFDQFIGPIKSFLGPLVSLISIVAPALYAWGLDQPLITSYYDVLEILIQFTLR